MKGQKLFSLVEADGTLSLYSEIVDAGAPGPDEVVIRIEAAPINPSDLALLLASADLNTVRPSGTPDMPAIEATIPPELLKGLAGRIGVPMPVGNEGAGLVVAAGQNATHLMGKTVACMGRAMYAQYIRIPANACHLLPEGFDAVDGAASIVNPLTSLAMIETMRAEGHSALIHSAAASSLGQMLNRLCLEQDITLINIVRRQEQADLLLSQGAKHVFASSDDAFSSKLSELLYETQATIAFDAIGGGPLIDQLLDSMETAALRRATHYSRYGSMTRKTVYVYGGLDGRPIHFRRGFDFSWTVSGWLLPLSQQRMAELWKEAAPKLKTTFSTSYAASLSLDEILMPEILVRYASQGTGQKILVSPHK